MPALAAGGWGCLAAVPMGTEPGTIQIRFAFPLPPYSEKQLPPWEYFHNPSFPVRRRLIARAMDWEECQERGDNCQEATGIAAKTSIPTHGKDFV